MKLQLANLKELGRKMKLKNLPFLFEHYELYIVAAGAAVVLLVSGFLFYTKAYQAVAIPPEVSVTIPKINRALFDKALQDLEEKKQPASSEPITDLFGEKKSSVPSEPTGE